MVSLAIRRGRSAAAAALLCAVAACEGAGGNVSVLQSDPAAVAPGTLYAWAPVNERARQAADYRVSNDIIQSRLRNAVDTNLSAHGLRQVYDPGQAQLLATYHVGLQDKTETRVDTWGGGPAYACGFRGCVGGWGLYGPPQVDVRNIDYVQGTLILDLIDRSSGRLVWRAVSNKRVDQADANQSGLDAIVADMTKTLNSGK